MSKHIKENIKYCPGRCYYFFSIIGALLLGIGTFLIGVGGIFALKNTDKIIEKVMEIRNMVAILKHEIETQMAYIYINNSPSLLSKTADYEQIKSDLMKIPNDVIGSKGTVILPKNKLDKLAKDIYESKSVDDRLLILKNVLEYVPSEGK